MKFKISILTLIIICFGWPSNCFSQHYGYCDDFHNFIIRFTSERGFQFNNTSFPLLTISDKDTTFIAMRDWKYIDYCFGCEFSPILFMGDAINFKDGYYKILNDTDYVVSAYIMPEKKIQDFHFYKTNNTWKLKQLCFTDINSSSKESFFDFIDNFATDTSFVRQRLIKGFVYTTWIDSPNEIVDVPVEMKWFADDEYLYKRIYINKFDMESDIYKGRRNRISP